MDRAGLERLLDEGLSLEDIGRRLARHPSTVGYWLRKHGLEANGRARHAPRGGIPIEALEPLVADGLSIREIAAELEVGYGTVRHWLRRHGLRTKAAERPRTTREDRDAADPVVLMVCFRHGTTEFGLRADGYRRCLRCRSDDVAKRRRRVKEILVADAGGSCAICGYDRCIAAMHFHHVDPQEKSFSLADRGLSRSLESARAEARKCVLLCSNCHAEVETGMVSVP